MFSTASMRVHRRQQQGRPHFPISIRYGWSRLYWGRTAATVMTGERILHGCWSGRDRRLRPRRPWRPTDDPRCGYQVAATRGDISKALELLVDAPKRCRRLPDTYLWIEAYGLDALCGVAVDNGAEGIGRWIDELESIAARRGMRELLLRATLYRARLGEPGALDAARSLAGQINNPVLGDLFASAELRAVAG
jgi:hypothetical protein